MITIEPRVDAGKLQQLLAEAHESGCLEYVAACNLDERRDTVELATEVGALAALGGYVVIGVDDRGNPTGDLNQRMAELFDDATVRDKLGRYLPDLDLHVGKHDHGDGPIILIAVMPHPDGAVAFVSDGAYEARGKEAVAFRKGEVLVRHGSKSERPNQSDISRIRTNAVKHAEIWTRQLDKLADVVLELRRVVDDEAASHPDGRLYKFGVPTQVPIVRERLKVTLGLIDQTGGPELPATHRLADESHHVVANHLRSDIASAISEISSVAQRRAAPS